MSLFQPLGMPQNAPPDMSTMYPQGRPPDGSQMPQVAPNGNGWMPSVNPLEQGPPSYGAQTVRQEGRPSQFPQEGRPSEFPQEGRPAEFPQEGRPSEYSQIPSYTGQPVVDKYIHSFIGIA